jgi:hypothetical protein
VIPLKRIVLDNMLPRKLAVFLQDRYVVAEARIRGWDQIGNGVLLREAEVAGFDVLVTADKNMRSQQTLAGRAIALVALGAQEWGLIEAYIERVVAAIDVATPGSFAFVEIPLSPKRRSAPT